MAHKDDLKINFSPDPGYLIDGLVNDVTTIECIYDLIDNSIDAARSVITSRRSYKKDRHGLPASYDGFSIDLSISSDFVRIIDNCSGLTEEIISKKAFSTGSKSNHTYGIGHYGVGLKRAIFKLGEYAHVQTESGKERFTLDFTENDVRQALRGEKEIFAKRQGSRKAKSFKLEISKIKSSVTPDLGSDAWIDTLSEGVRVRYALFNKKGLKINVNGVPPGSFGPEIRTPDFLGPDHRVVTSANGVKVFLSAGLHQDYRIKGVDPDYDDHKTIISNLTHEYGWYIVCNDRIILVADKSKTTGWTTTWHNEYHGFLGWAHYISEDPALLPWNSKKTGVNPNNQAHIEALGELRSMADLYRSANRSLRHRKSNASKPEGGSSTSSTGQENGTASPNSSSGSGSSSNSTGGGSEKNKPPHTNEMINLLGTDIALASRSPKISSLVAELMFLSTEDNSYTALVMLRVLFEAAIKDFLRRNSHYEKVRAHHFEMQEKDGRPLSLTQKRDFSPSLQAMCSWTFDNIEVIDINHRRSVKISLGCFLKSLKKINGIIHEDGVITNKEEVRIIRNESYEALKSFLEL